MNIYKGRATEKIIRILENIKEGKTSVRKGLKELSLSSTEELGFAVLDHHRHIRRSFPEVIFAEGKTPNQVLKIADSIHEFSKIVLITRATEEYYSLIYSKFPKAVYNKEAEMILIDSRKRQKLIDGLTVLSAGTSDIPIAEQVVFTAEAMGCKTNKIYDIGIAGLQRITNKLEKIRDAKILVVVAGMDGALPTVISGLVSVPVIAVPTSIGYGSTFEGVSALLTMINGCSPGVSVVGIDNGFGAGYTAALTLHSLMK
ncbi:MAG: 1-(5-phosphoribosyl)-5-amino-4-imidazole-carboxylate carboxylase [Chloroflexi bacterium]|nr:1-(5-phosphoribosyl)-5-amino-4-imidazole-carboxylate carboxylase [Chloroflexota bacterium]